MRWLPVTLPVSHNMMYLRSSYLSVSHNMMHLWRSYLSVSAQARTVGSYCPVCPTMSGGAKLHITKGCSPAEIVRTIWNVGGKWVTGIIVWGPLSLLLYDHRCSWGRGRGSEEFEVDFQFLTVSDRGECQLPGTFYGMKKFISLPKLSHFEI